MARVNEVYLATDKNFDLECRYLWNSSYKLITPKGETRRDSSTMGRDFVIENGEASIPMSFKVIRDGRNANYEAVFDNIHVSRNKVSSKREFFLAGLSDKNFQNQFETSQIYCYVNFAYAEPYVLKDGDYHFSVHPQKNYDWQSRLSLGIETLLKDQSMQSVVFLENGNLRGNLVSFRDFFEGREPNLPMYVFETELTDIPTTTDLVVSPAGNSRFDIKANNQINIKFTGGNHNYCIWNVTRHVLQDFLHSNSEARFTLRYDLNLIVAQGYGIEGLPLDFPARDINRSNLLKDLLSTPAKQERYHGSYIQYFTGYLAREYQGMYKTYTVKYSAPGFKREVVLNGNGTRDLIVDFIYE